MQCNTSLLERSGDTTSHHEGKVAKGDFFEVFLSCVLFLFVTNEILGGNGTNENLGWERLMEPFPYQKQKQKTKKKTKKKQPLTTLKTM